MFDKNNIIVKETEVKTVMTKSSLPVGGWSVNPYVGCPHACRYCYASFMKRFTGHTEDWGTFLDVKRWKPIENPKKYAHQRVVIGSVTDGYNPLEAEFGRTRAVLEELRGSGADILICTKSDLVLRDLDLLLEMDKIGTVTVSWSVNTIDEDFRRDMDDAASIERRIAAMKTAYDAGLRTVCFVSPVFPALTDFEAIFARVKNQCDLFWLENLNLRGGFKKRFWTTSQKNTPTSCRFTTKSTTITTAAISRAWRKKRGQWRKKTARRSLTTKCPTAAQSGESPSWWIIFTTRKSGAARTRGSGGSRTDFFTKYAILSVMKDDNEKKQGGLSDIDPKMLAR